MSTDNEEEIFARRGFGMRIGFGSHPALIVIDIIRAFTDPGRPLGSDLSEQIVATQKLLAVAHDRKFPVIFSTVRYDETDNRDAGIWRLKMRGIADLAAGTNGHEIDERLDVRASDGMLLKKYSSCFFGTDLAPRLTSQGVDTLIIAGCSTSGCVRATAVDSVQSGFRPMVVSEAVGDRSKKAHDQSLFDLNAKYADVVSLEETIQYMRRVGHNNYVP
ncbi:isochorismatase family protein [Pseudorhodoplanes sinuspersici]|uniref:isochorismatase family protein n=1 Tax=Pseudorhodoplanes sinuspersici TaxID=1235591 RepID=UPI000FF14C35|nr:isochorismatase family protein [Pseudorhodoplanes sinuspersici]RKE68239.1 nicotinamidase-related amidase [Pseudorhodoplanes sinuspersici]